MKAALGLAVAAVLMAPAVASAGTVTVTDNSTVLRYSDSSGQADNLSVRRDVANSDTIRISRNGGTITANAANCTANAGTVTCSGANQMTRAVIDTGGGDDSVDFSDLGFPGEALLGPGIDAAGIVDQDRAFIVVLRGGDGPDNLIGGHGNDTLDGGADSDYLQGREGADDISGGAGFDLVDYYGEPGRLAPITVTLDDQRNDGSQAATELDNVHTDVEDVNGTLGDDVLVGSAASNILDGREGNDRLEGGAGVDVLFGGFGNDTLLARDGIGERVDCSRGTDSATIDDNDSPNGCETVDSSPEQIPDRDGDGISKPADCNDANDAIRPGAFDVPDDNVDQNCDGVDAVNLDRDRDGVNRPQDCDDSQASRHPGAFDIPGNRLDEDCDLADAPLPQLKPGLSYFAARAGTRSRLTRLTVTGIQRGDVVAISCPKPKSCKVRDRTVTAPRAGTLPLARYVKARLARRTVIQLVVSRAGFRSSTFLLTMKGPGKAPAVAQLCEPAGDEPSTKCS